MTTSLASKAARSSRAAASHSRPLRYADVRNEMQDGDVLLLDGQQVLSSLVKRLTKGDYSHCGIVLTWNDRRMLVHADVANGVQATLLSSALARLGRQGFVWLRLSETARRELDLEALRSEAQSHLGLSYDLWGVMQAGAHVFLGTPRPEHVDWPQPTHCSAFVARCFRKAGLPLFERPDGLVSPADIARSQAFVAQGVVHAAAASITIPKPVPSLRARIKQMSLDLIEKAALVLPAALANKIQRAMQTEALVEEGQAQLALNEGEGSRYERVLRHALEDVAEARRSALVAVDAFQRGDISLEQALCQVDTWNDVGAQALWQRLEDIDLEVDG